MTANIIKRVYEIRIKSSVTFLVFEPCPLTALHSAGVHWEDVVLEQHPPGLV